MIGQAALSGQNTVGWKNNTRAAPPTFTHHALGFLGLLSGTLRLQEGEREGEEGLGGSGCQIRGRQGLLHGWVQQNHDGLPQKASLN